MVEFEVIFPFLGEGVVERRIEYRMWSHTQATAIQPDDTTTCSRGGKKRVHRSEQQARRIITIEVNKGRGVDLRD